MIRESVKSWLLKRGMVVSRPPGQINVFGHKLTAAKHRGLNIRGTIDGGAAEGGWARQFKAVYPDAWVICIEPRSTVQTLLSQLRSEFSNIAVVQSLLGATEGQVEFNESGMHSSALPNSRGESFGTKRTVPVSTLDAIVAKQNLGWPDLIKLDLQGYEMQALKGGEQCMQHAQALFLELSFQNLQAGAALADEMIAFLRERQFQIYDIPALTHRPLDGALAQADFLFVKKGHPLFADGRWSPDAEFS